MPDFVISMLAGQNVDALLVSSKSNIFALSGFKGSNGLVLLTDKQNYLFTDPRYTEKAESVVPPSWRVVDMSGGLFDQLQTAVAKHKLRRVGFESNQVTYAFYKRLQTLTGVEWVETVEAIERTRMVKDASARKQLRMSQRLNEETLKMAIERVKPGITEIGLAWIIRGLAHDMGADDVSFPPIVAFGAHTARPHHEPTAKKLKRGDVILIDMGIFYKAFASDMTRVFFTKTPTSEQGDLYQTVVTAHQSAVLAVKPGAKADDVDRAARLYISDSGYKGKFGHATGHGIGYDVHELPRMAKGDMTKLELGMVIAIEPGIYLPKKFGVRIEDLVEVTAEGGKTLNRMPKDLASARIKI